MRERITRVYWSVSNSPPPSLSNQYVLLPKIVLVSKHADTFYFTLRGKSRDREIDPVDRCERVTRFSSPSSSNDDEGWKGGAIRPKIGSEELTYYHFGLLRVIFQHVGTTLRMGALCEQGCPMIAR